jgi:hypothetical protein
VSGRGGVAGVGGGNKEPDCACLFRCIGKACA